MWRRVPRNASPPRSGSAPRTVVAALKRSAGSAVAGSVQRAPAVLALRPGDPMHPATDPRKSPPEPRPTTRMGGQGRSDNASPTGAAPGIIERYERRTKLRARVGGESHGVPIDS